MFKDQDAVVSLISTADVSQQETIIDAAVAAGVKRFLPSEFGSDTSVENLAGIAPLLAPKQEVVRYLRTKEPAGLSWTALCSGSWIDWVSTTYCNLLFRRIISLEMNEYIIGKVHLLLTYSFFSLFQNRSNWKKAVS